MPRHSAITGMTLLPRSRKQSSLVSLPSLPYDSLLRLLVRSYCIPSRTAPMSSRQSSVGMDVCWRLDCLPLPGIGRLPSHRQAEGVIPQISDVVVVWPPFSVILGCSSSFHVYFEDSSTHLRGSGLNSICLSWEEKVGLLGPLISCSRWCVSSELDWLNHWYPRGDSGTKKKPGRQRHGFLLGYVLK